MIILGIETTCDETGVALVKDGREILSDIVASSADLQKKYGGVVPEVAAREQVRMIIPTLGEAIHGFAKDEIDAIAVAFGPGLVGSLLIGVETAKTLAFAWDKPLYAVNHLVAHVYANWLISRDRETLRRNSGRAKSQGVRDPEFPLVALIVSGGHTDLVLMKDHGDFKLLGTTADDAAGEAFDKVAKTLRLSYPGGPEIERAAERFTVHSSQLTVPTSGQVNSGRAVHFPRPMIGSGDFNFSFSGLKTSVVNYVKERQLEENEINMVAFEFQEAVCDVLVSKTISAARKFNCKSVVVGGGVAANGRLKKKMADKAVDLGINTFSPSKKNSIDNGAMIAAAAFFSGTKADPLKLQANSGLHF